MKKIKVLHITFDMAIGGAEQLIRQLIESADTTIYGHQIACLDGKTGEIGQELIKQGINIKQFTRQPGFDFELIKQVRKYILGNKIDIVHCHQYTPYIYGLFASLGSGCKVIFTEHGRFYPDSYKWKRYLINPFISMFTDAIIAISESTGEALVKYENFPKHKIKVFYNGTTSFHADKNNQFKNEFNIPLDHIVMGTISRLDPIKNQKMMIMAFAELARNFSNIHLLIIGDGPERESLQQLTRELLIEDNVCFTGFIVNPQRYLPMFDIFLLSSLSEGTSMTLLEAMSCAIPAVVTNVGGNPEIVINNETGIVTENDNMTAYSAAIQKLLENSELCISMGNAAKSRFDKLFSIEKMQEAYSSLYKKLAGQKA